MLSIAATVWELSIAFLLHVRITSFPVLPPSQYSISALCSLRRLFVWKTLKKKIKKKLEFLFSLADGCFQKEDVFFGHKSGKRHFVSRNFFRMSARHYGFPDEFPEKYSSQDASASYYKFPELSWTCSFFLLVFFVCSFTFSFLLSRVFV